MGIIRTAVERLREAERENTILKRELAESKAMTDYIAIMCDIDLDDGDEEPETDGIEEEGGE